MTEKIREVFRSEKAKYFYVAVFVLLTLFFVQCGYIRDAYVILLFGGIAVFYALLCGKNIIGYREIILTLAIGIYGYMSLDLKVCLCMTVILVVFQCLGKSLEMYRHGVNEDKRGILNYLMIAIIIGYSVHALLNSFGYDIWRIWPDFWTKIMLPATQHALFFLPIFALIFPLALCFKGKKIINIAVWFVALADIMFSLKAENRLVPVILILVCIVQVFGYMLDKNTSLENKKKAAKRFGIAISCLLTVCIFGVILMYYMSPALWDRVYGVVNRDGGILNNIRFKAQASALSQIFVYPMGGFHMDLCGLNSCHNVWLDIANASGVIPFALFVVYTIISMMDLFRYVRHTEDSATRKSILIGLYVTFVLYYMVEPALLANYYYLIPWIFVNGIISSEKK